MIIIPGQLIALLTFPGVIVHELAHLIFCNLFNVKVAEVCFFRADDIPGYVIHETTTNAWKVLGISMGPLIVNTLVNICEVEVIGSINPIMFSFRGDEGNPGEGSELAVLISARMKDYLERKSDGELVEGDRKKKEVERIWSFTYENGKWVVSNIEESSHSLEYIEMMKTTPNIEEALALRGKAAVGNK